MKRRIIAFTLMLALVLSCMPVMAFAQTGSSAILTVDDVYATPGSTVTVDIKVANNPGILGATLSVSWGDGLTLTGHSSGEAFSELRYQGPSRLISGCNFIWYGDSVRNIVDGTILTLTFDVTEAAADADIFDIKVTYDSVDVLDQSYNPVELTVHNGSVRIVTYTPGDVTGDGRINTLDLIKLSQYISDGRKTDPNGFNVTINESAADVNDDGRMNTLDLIWISQYISDGCKTDPDGYNITLKPSTPKCAHVMQATAAKAATCTEDGNIAYWYCTKCKKYFSNESGSAEITLAQTILAAEGHTVVIDPAVAPTYTTSGLTEGSHCSKCNEVFVEQQVLAPIKGFAISYNIVGTDTYLAQQVIENPNPEEYNPEQETIVLINLTAPDGYEFLGWYDAPQSVGGNRITEIPKGSTGDKMLYAYWQEETFDITYKLYQTPLGPITEEKFLHYTVSKGLKDLPNPEINNYVFLGWYTDDGTEVKEISVGTTGDITLNAYWTSKRNLAKAVGALEDPIIIENSDEGVIYFTYELGTIENVPLSDAIWTIQSVAGLAQQKSETVSTTISNEQAKQIAAMVSQSTVDSATWTLSKDWNDVTEVNEEWAEQNGMSQEEANEITKTESGTYSITSSNGGCDTTTKTDGTTTVDYKSQNYTHGNSAEFNAKINAKYTSEVKVNVGIDDLGVSGGKKFEVGGEIGGGYKQHQETNEHTGTDKTTVNTTVKAGSTSWNKASTSSKTKEASESIAVKNALSQIISNTKGYGKSYSSGGENSESQGFSSTDSQSTNSSSSLTYFTSETKTTTTTYSTDGKSEGCYRLVIAGTIHVFGVVGYDVATQSYFTYTFNVLDDKTYEFLDFSPDLRFKDYNNGALPFEIPYFVHEYVAEKTVRTEGLSFKTNSSDGTAMLIGFENSAEKDVVIPSYFSSGNTAYKVTGISANAFAGKSIESVVLSEYITEIPDGAFKNCTSLKQIAGSFTVIGNEAFSGCTNLENFTVSALTTEIGTDAFKNVPSVKVNVLNADAAMAKAKKDMPNATEAERILYARECTKRLVDAAVSAGAQNVILDISKTIDDVEFTIDVAEISSFELLGGKKSYKNLRVKSAAGSTILRELTIRDCSRIPLEISSDNLTLEVVNVESQGYALLLSSNAPSITLIRDNRLTAISGEAVVCKAPEVISKIVDQAVGTLVISGNVYVNGTTEKINQLKQSAYLEVKNGEIIAISEEMYSQYIKGSFNVTFDANGGSVGEETRLAFCGTAIGALPVPTRTGYNFSGWFMDNGTQVTADTVFSTVNNITLTAKWTAKTYKVSWNSGAGYSITVKRMSSPYAGAATGVLSNGDAIYYSDELLVTYTANDYYTLSDSGSTSITVSGDVTSFEIYATAELNPVSDWVKASEVPSDAQVIDQKWSYTLTTNTESQETALEGYTQIGSYWVQSGTGTKKYSTDFPSGFDKGHSIYTSFAKSAVAAYETETTKREVSNAKTGYVYWHWMYDCGNSAGTSSRPINNKKGTGESGWVYKYFGAFTSSKGSYESDKYYCNSLNITNYIIPERTAYNDCQGSTRWFRFTYYTSTYTDYYKMFQYQKVENLESETEITESDDISNVQEWVRYRAK